MSEVTVVLHRDPETGWWADSPDVEGWTATDPDLHQLRVLIAEGLAFFLDTEDFVVDERWDPDMHPQVGLVGSYTSIESASVVGSLKLLSGGGSLAPLAWPAVATSNRQEPVSA